MAETLSDIMGIKDPFAQNVLKASKAKGEVEAAEKQEKAYGQQEMAKAEAATTEQFAKEREPTELKQKYEKTIDELGQPFIPTQQTAGDLGNIFAMTNILGFLIGGGAKGSAQAALSAQNGMLEGYQKGQQDVYKKQKDIFDENQKSLSKAVEGLRDELKRAADTASVNKELGLAQARQAIANHQAKQMGEYLDKMGVAATYELSEKAWQINEKLKAEKRAEEDRAERRSIEQQRLTLEKENKNKPDYEYVVKDGKTYAVNKRDYKDIHEITGVDFTGATKLGATQKGTGGGTGGVIQFRYNGAVATAADKLGIHLENLGSAASTSEVPRVGDVLTSERTVPTAMIKYFATTLTEPQNRALQQELAPTIREIANIESAGRPGGVTQSSVNELGKMAPVGGDQKINYYMFLALAKQEAAIAKTTLEVSGGTKEQIDAAQKAIDKINKVVSWDVKDINRILTGPDGNTLVNDKMQNMLARSNGLDQFNTFVEQQKTNGGAETQSLIDPTTGYPTVNARGYVLHRDINGNFAYVSPDGKTYEEIK